MIRPLRIALVLACFATSATAVAQPKRDQSSALADSLSGDARRAYDEARALYTQAQYARALDALGRAHKLSPDPRLFWNMAACEKKLGRYASAVRHVERYRSGAATMLSEAEKREADDFVSAASAYVGTVDVASNADGTEVIVDEELLGTTPLPKPIVVDEGEHRVRFVRSSYRTVERIERIPAGARLRWVVDLERDVPAPPLPAPVPPKTAADDRSTRSPSRLGPLLLGGAGIVAAGGGTFFVFSAHAQGADIESDCGTRCPPSRWEAERTRETIGDVLIGVGAAAVVASAVWWVLQR